MPETRYFMTAELWQKANACANGTGPRYDAETEEHINTLLFGVSHSSSLAQRESLEAELAEVLTNAKPIAA